VLEREHLERMTLAVLRRCLAALEIRLDLVPSWRGAELARLLDERHAAMQARLAERLRRWGWQVFVEVSFNHYGDRGRVDLVAYYPPLGLLLIGEVKSEIADAQGLLGTLDVKLRLAAHIAARLGLPRPTRVLPLLLVPDAPTARRRIRRLTPLFARFSLRGRAAAHLLRRPDPRTLEGVTGLLVFSNQSYAHGGSTKSVGTQRVRRTGSTPSVAGPPSGAVAARRPTCAPDDSI
jgi:hypothetical protein